MFSSFLFSHLFEKARERFCIMWFIQFILFTCKDFIPPCDFGVHQALLPHTSRGNAILLLHLLLLVLEYQELLLRVVSMMHLLRCHIIMIVRFHLYLFFLISLITSRKYLLLLSTFIYQIVCQQQKTIIVKQVELTMRLPYLLDSQMSNQYKSCHLSYPLTPIQSPNQMIRISQSRKQQ